MAKSCTFCGHELAFGKLLWHVKNLEQALQEVDGQDISVTSQQCPLLADLWCPLRFPIMLERIVEATASHIPLVVSRQQT